MAELGLEHRELRFGRPDEQDAGHASRLVAERLVDDRVAPSEDRGAALAPPAGVEDGAARRSGREACADRARAVGFPDRGRDANVAAEDRGRVAAAERAAAVDEIEVTIEGSAVRGQQTMVGQSEGAVAARQAQQLVRHTQVGLEMGFLLGCQRRLGLAIDRHGGEPDGCGDREPHDR